MKEQKEFMAINSTIAKWVKKNKGNVNFCGSFVSFDKKGDVEDNVFFAYGDKGGLKIAMKEIEKEIKKEKGDFVNL